MLFIMYIYFIRLYDLDSRTMDEDRGAAYAFFTRGTVSLAAWLHDMESIFRICHIQPHLQVPLADDV